MRLESHARQEPVQYFSECQWAERLLDGEILFRSLSYYRDYEDSEVRGDRNEGSRPCVGKATWSSTISRRARRSH